MINMIIARYADWIQPRGFFFSDFWVYYTNRPSRHIRRCDKLKKAELDFIAAAVRNGNIVKTYTGIIYKCVDSKAQFDLDERERVYKDRAFQGYHKKEKSTSHGKKKAVTHTG